MLKTLKHLAIAHFDEAQKNSRRPKGKAVQRYVELTNHVDA